MTKKASVFLEPSFEIEALELSWMKSKSLRLKSFLLKTRVGFRLEGKQALPGQSLLEGGERVFLEMNTEMNLEPRREKTLSDCSR